METDVHFSNTIEYSLFETYTSTSTILTASVCRWWQPLSSINLSRNSPNGMDYDMIQFMPSPQVSLVSVNRLIDVYCMHYADHTWSLIYSLLLHMFKVLGELAQRSNPAEGTVPFRVAWPYRPQVASTISLPHGLRSQEPWVLKPCRVAGIEWEGADIHKFDV